MSEVQHPFTLCTANAPRKVLKLGQQSLQDDGIESPCLLVVEEGSSLDEDEWLDVLDSSSDSQECTGLCVHAMSGRVVLKKALINLLLQKALTVVSSVKAL